MLATKIVTIHKSRGHKDLLTQANTRPPQKQAMAMTTTMNMMKKLPLARLGTILMVIAGNFLGLLLVGGMMIAIGLMVSALTESQVIAALGTLAVSVILMSVDMLSSIFASISWLAEIIDFVSVSSRYANFTVGLIEYDNIIFFLSLQALFIFITVRVLDSKRWK